MHELYREHILDHYKHPRNRGHLGKPDAVAEESNPLCGDHIRIELKFGGRRERANVACIADGCVMSTASASLLSEAIKGKTKGEMEKFNYETALGLIGIPVSPGRLNCVLLPLVALRKALRQIHVHD